MEKIEYYGIRGIALDWFSSYLCNRKQFANLNGIDSSILTILYGVPQGSILGQLLFLIYINDIVNRSELTKFIIFADNSNLIFKQNILAPWYLLLTPSSLKYLSGSN